jgi:hypothetical protein
MACVDYGPATFACRLGISAEIANRACEMIALLVAGITFALLRGLELTTLFGLAAGFGRLWTYHRVYDNFMLIILLVALADAYARTERQELGVAMIALGASLWLPSNVADTGSIQITHVLIWSAGTIALAVWAPRPAVSTDKANATMMRNI